MLIRTKLLLLGLATLALPWAGCQYVREVEGSLRVAESQSLLAVAQTIATSLRGRRDLLFRGVDGARPGEPAGPYDFEPLPLASAPQLDGRDDDWPRREARLTRRFTSPRPGETLEVRTATFERYLYLLVIAPADRLVFDAGDDAALDPAASGDRVWVAYTTPEGERAQLFVSGWNTGAVRGRRVATRELGRPELVEEPRVQGAWRSLGKPDAASHGGGWALELRLPLSMLGHGFGVLLDDRDTRGAAPSSYGSLAPRDLVPRGRLVAAAPELAAYLAQFGQPGVRIAAATPGGAVLAEANALPAVGAGVSGSQALLSQFYRRLLEGSSLAQRPAEPERGRLDAQQVREVAAGAGQHGAVRRARPATPGGRSRRAGARRGLRPRHRDAAGDADRRPLAAAARPRADAAAEPDAARDGDRDRRDPAVRRASRAAPGARAARQRRGDDPRRPGAIEFPETAAAGRTRRRRARLLRAARAPRRIHRSTCAPSPASSRTRSARR